MPKEWIERATDAECLLLLAPGKRVQTIRFRGRVAVAFAFVAVILQFTLNELGLASFHFEGDPNLDQSLGNRICLMADWMLLACLAVYLAAMLRVRYANLFREQAGRWLPIGIGLIGAITLFVSAWQYSHQPYSGAAFGFVEGWRFGVSWLLLWWACVFRP